MWPLSDAETFAVFPLSSCILNEMTIHKPSINDRINLLIVYEVATLCFVEQSFEILKDGCLGNKMLMKLDIIS